MAEEYRYPNTIELCSKPPGFVRYLWVLQVEDETYNGMSWNGLMKAFRREGIEPEGPLPKNITLKMIDIVNDMVIPIPHRLNIERLLEAWRRNYYNPDWELKKKQ